MVTVGLRLSLIIKHLCESDPSGDQTLSHHSAVERVLFLTLAVWRAAGDSGAAAVTTSTFGS